MAARVDWSRFSGDPRRGDVAGVRATDADRDAAVEALREAYADGRLDRAEFDERSSTALEVRLLGEFVAILADLDPPVPATHGVHAQAVDKFRRESRDARNGTLSIAVITSGVWAATSVAAGELSFFWPVFPIVAVGAGWFLHVLNRRERIERHERRINRRLERRDED